jgi:hypothetical protein
MKSTIKTWQENLRDQDLSIPVSFTDISKLMMAEIAELRAQWAAQKLAHPPLLPAT